MTFRHTVACALIFSFLFSIQQARSDDAAFALYLYRSGDFAAAAVELNRFIFDHPADTFNPYARYLAALSHARIGEYERALSQLFPLIDELSGRGLETASEALFCESQLQVLNILFRQKRFQDYYLYRERFEASCPLPDAALTEYLFAMDVAIPVYNFDWEGALARLNKSGAGSEKLRMLLEEKLSEAMGRRLKRPALGAILSVIPGGGHLYAGRPWDGMRSFFINAGVISLSIFCFTMGIPVLGVVFAVIEAFLYASSVYGGMNAVLQVNAHYQVEKRDEVLRYLVVPPLDAITIREELGFR